jgi:hypothetical protein
MLFNVLLRKVKFERDHEKEYMVKAAMLIKFYQHTQWPESIYRENPNKITICIVGKDPFPKKAKKLFINASKPERQYILVKGNAYKKQFCHMVFIGNCSKKLLDNTLNYLKHLPTLTVSDIPGFAHMGGNVELTIRAKSDEDQTVNLIVNEQATLEKGLIFAEEMKNPLISTMIRKSN